MGTTPALPKVPKDLANTNIIYCGGYDISWCQSQDIACTVNQSHPSITPLTPSVQKASVVWCFQYKTKAQIPINTAFVTVLILRMGPFVALVSHRHTLSTEHPFLSPQQTLNLNGRTGETTES